MRMQEITLAIKAHAGIGAAENRLHAKWIVDVTWNRRISESDVLFSMRHFLGLLAEFNAEFNAESRGYSDAFSRDLLFAIHEVMRMLRQAAVRIPEMQTLFLHCDWQVFMAWHAILSGDVDDLLEYLEHEESASP